MKCVDLPMPMGAVMNTLSFSSNEEKMRGIIALYYLMVGKTTGSYF